MLRKRVGLKKSKKVSKSEVSLPTKPNEPSHSLGDYSMLLYGRKKAGKTSLASRFPEALFLSCEPGTKALRVYQRDVTTWEEYLAYCELLEGEHDFSTVVVDTIDLLYDYCFDYICRRKMIKHPSDENDFGKTWKEIAQEFYDGFMRLNRLPIGKIFISHDQMKDMELRDGGTCTLAMPTMDRRALTVCEAQIDIIAFYTYIGGDRYLYIDGTEEIVAGNRLEENFIREGGEPRAPGDRIKSIPMGKSSQQAYDNLLSAFLNKQEDVQPHKTKTTDAKPKRRRIAKRRSAN